MTRPQSGRPFATSMLAAQAAERRTVQAVAENAAIADEVEAMRTALTRLQSEHDKAGRRGPQASPRKTTPGPKVYGGQGDLSIGAAYIL